MDIRWEDELKAYRIEQVAGGAPATSIRVRMHYVGRLAKDGYPVDASRGQLLEWLAADKHARWSANTRKAVRSHLIHFYSWRVRTGRSDANQAADLPSVKSPRGLPRPAPRSAVQAGFCSTHPHVPLMVELAAHAGLRRSEIANIRHEHLGDRGLFVRGKGGKDRFVPMTDSLREQIEARAPGFLFPGQSGGHLSPNTVGRLVRAETGYSPHKFRHRFASQGFEGSRNLLAVQQVLGHSSVDTTQGYIAISPAAMLEVVLAAAA